MSDSNGVIKEYEHENCFWGYVGAVLGTLIGALPWILINAFADANILLLSILLPIGAVRGYKVFKGIVNKNTFKTILIISAIVAIVTVVYIIPLVISEKNDYVLSKYWNSKENTEYFDDVSEQFETGIVSFAVGCFIAYCEIQILLNRYKATNGTIKDTNTFIRDDNSPIDSNEFNSGMKVFENNHHVKENKNNSTSTVIAIIILVVAIITINAIFEGEISYDYEKLLDDEFEEQDKTIDYETYIESEDDYKTYIYSTTEDNGEKKDVLFDYPSDWTVISKSKNLIVFKSGRGHKKFVMLIDKADHPEYDSLATVHEKVSDDIMEKFNGKELYSGETVNKDGIEYTTSYFWDDEDNAYTITSASYSEDYIVFVGVDNTHDESEKYSKMAESVGIYRY